MKAFNTSHLYFEQVSVDQKGVIDSFWVIKDEHKLYSHSKDEFWNYILTQYNYTSQFYYLFFYLKKTN